MPQLTLNSGLTIETIPEMGHPERRRALLYQDGYGSILNRRLGGIAGLGCERI